MPGSALIVLSQDMLNNCQPTLKTYQSNMALHFQLQHLEAFAAVANAGSLGKAAQSLNTSQPALSRTIRNLEVQVGESLFERHTRGMQLTQAGQTLLPHANAIVSERARAAEELLALKGMARGTVRVGAIPGVAAGVLPQAIRRLMDGYPRLRIEVIEDTWDRLSLLLLTYQLDIALAAVGGQLDAGLMPVKDCCWKDRSTIVSASSHPLQSRPVRLIDTHAQRWAMPPRGSPPYLAFSSVWASRGLEAPEVFVETRSAGLIKSLVREGGFLTVMPRSSYLLEYEQDLLRPLVVSGVALEFTISAYRRSGGALPRPAEELLREIRKVVNSPLSRL